MKFKHSIFAVIVFTVLFTSCFNNLKAPKETSVSFYMDEATVQKILQASAKPRSAASSRAAADEQNDTAGYFIDVTLIGEVDQTQTASLSTDVQMSFTNILVNSRVYAKAQIYKYLNNEQSEKEIIFRGESKKITVRDNGNVLSIKLTTATLTVTFDSNGGSEVPSQLVQTGSAATEPEKPVKPEGKKKYSRENYAFAGWFTDSELTKEYNFELPVKDDLTLYAKWLPDFVFVEGATVNDYLTTGRNVKISDLFVSDHEVTQAEYQSVIGSNPSSNKAADDLPVENVTWLDAIKYCNKLSENEGLDPCYKINDSEVTCTLSANGYRLPTEAEWEYIAGKAKRDNTSFSNLAWTADNASTTHQVKYNLADELSLCDIYGNVAEWCFDVYSDTVTKSTGPTGPMAVVGTPVNRVVRGGSFQSSAAECTPQARFSADPAEKSAAIGFRVVRTVVYEFKIARNTVSFDSNGGSAVSIQIVIQGDCAAEPADPARTGYIFKGWKYADEDFDFSSPITQDIMLEAQWEAIKYKIKFNGGASTAGSMPDQEFTYDVEAELSENAFEPPNNGLKFGGWSKTAHTTAPAEIDNDFDDKQRVKNLTAQDGEEITLYALWIDKDACRIYYTGIPNGVDNSANPTQFLIRNNVTLQNITRDYYDFGGWYERDDASQTIITGWNANTKTSDVYLCAKWTPIEYDIHYENIDDCTWTAGSANPAKFTVEDSPTLVTSNGISKPGYTFEGWYDGWDVATHTAAGNRVYGWNAGDYTEEVTLYAKWSIVTYDISYLNKDYSSWTGNEEVPYDFTVEDDITLPTSAGITRTGYTFEGWYDSWDNVAQTVAGNQVTAWLSGQVTDDVDVYAKWEAINYTITYMSNGVDVTDANSTFKKTFIFDEDVDLSSYTLSRTGYTFKGWYSSQNETTHNGTGEEITGWSENEYSENITVYAKWQEEHADAGIDVIFGSTIASDIDVNKSISGNTITFTAPSTGYSYYTWEFDGEVVQESATSYEYSINKATLVNGVYDVCLSAVRTSDNKTYTWIQQIIIPEN